MGNSNSGECKTEGGKALARGDQKAVLSLQDYRKKLLAAAHASYPDLDRLMLEVAVDTFILHPDLTPDELTKDVPKDYFLNNKLNVTDRASVTDVSDEGSDEAGGQEGSSR